MNREEIVKTLEIALKMLDELGCNESSSGRKRIVRTLSVLKDK